jgi:hypothetical protein
VLAVAFLAACGGGGGGSSPVNPVLYPGEIRWSPLQPSETIPSSVNLSEGDLWTSVAAYDNSLADRRQRFASFEIWYSVTPGSSATGTLSIGVLPTADGTWYSTEPQWVGSIDVGLVGSRRAIVSTLPIPPMSFRVALRASGIGGNVLRVNQVTIRAYGEFQ